VTDEHTVTRYHTPHFRGKSAVPSRRIKTEGTRKAQPASRVRKFMKIIIKRQKEALKSQ
jgi:hypothetical protein